MIRHESGRPDDVAARFEAAERQLTGLRPTMADKLATHSGPVDVPTRGGAEAAFLEAVAKIVEYSWDRECADFERMCEQDGEESQNEHVFVALTEARMYLERQADRWIDCCASIGRIEPHYTAYAAEWACEPGRNAVGVPVDHYLSWLADPYGDHGFANVAAPRYFADFVRIDFTVDSTRGDGPASPIALIVPIDSTGTATGLPLVFGL